MLRWIRPGLLGFPCSFVMPTFLFHEISSTLRPSSNGLAKLIERQCLFKQVFFFFLATHFLAQRFHVSCQLIHHTCPLRRSNKDNVYRILIYVWVFFICVWILQELSTLYFIVFNANNILCLFQLFWAWLPIYLTILYNVSLSNELI